MSKHDEDRDDRDHPSVKPPASQGHEIKRYYMMQLARIAMLGLTIGGLMIIAGRSELAPYYGYPLFLAGLLGFFYLPKWLAGFWRSEGR